MPFSIQVSEAVPDAARRIASEQIAATIGALDDVGLTDSDKVYTLRRRCKKLRALLRLVRDGLSDENTYVNENAQLRDIARWFSAIRDVDMLVDAYDGLTDRRVSPQIGDRRRFGPVRRKLTEDRERHTPEIGPALPMLLQDARRELEALGLRAASWRFNENGGGFKLLEGGLRGSYRRALQSRNQAAVRPTIDRLHNWRKQAKYHRNHLRILKWIEPTEMVVRINLANVLNDLLGNDHDLALMRGVIANNDSFDRISGLGEFVALIDQRRRDLQVQSFHCGKSLFAERPARLVQSLGAWWDSWHLQFPPTVVAELEASSA